MSRCCPTARIPASALLVAVLLSACRAEPAPAQAPAAERVAIDGAPQEPGLRFDAAAEPTLAVRRARTGHLLVNPLVNGREVGAFIFDTGAGICVVSTPHVASLGLSEAGAVEALGIGGSTASKTFVAESLELGPLTLSRHTLLATDLGFLEQHLGEPIFGVIGFGVLSRCVAELDFVTPRIALFDPARYELAEGASWLPLDLEGRTPAIRARFEDREGLFQIDTGANTKVAFHEPAVRRWQLLADRELGDARLGGVGGSIAAKSGKLAWFEFAGLRQDAVDALFPLERKGSRASATRDGAIGAPLLRPFVMVTDYSHGRIAFRLRVTGAGDAAKTAAGR